MQNFLDLLPEGSAKKAALAIAASGTDISRGARHRPPEPGAPASGARLIRGTNRERRGSIDMADASATTFGYTGDFQTYTVPQGVSRLQLTVTGATGGAGGNPGGGGGGGGGGGPGAGGWGVDPGHPPTHPRRPGGGASAQVTGFVNVTPGQQLTIDVGQAGGNGTGTGSNSAGAGGSPYDTDAAAGGGGNGDGTGGGGGGGGAASIVFSDPDTNSILVIAGGGGGGGGGGCFIAYN